MINFIDRVMCLALGHVWTNAGDQWGQYRWGWCPHCDRTIQDAELRSIAYRQRRRLLGRDSLSAWHTFPKRIW